MYNYYKNQIKCGNKIIDVYKQDINYVLLLAQMQSGKTGVCRYVIEQFIKQMGIKPENIYYICGINDKELRTQLIIDLKGVLDKSNILFSKQLDKHKVEKLKIKPEFVLIDESHYAGLIDSNIDNFLKTYSQIILYYLSISATPMGEIASMTNDCNKYKIILKPDKTYYGIKKIFENNRIWQSANLNGDYEDFFNIIDKEYTRQEETGWKYGIIRLNNRYYFEDLEKELNSIYDIKFINIHNDYNKIKINDFINIKPKKMTIIWIYNTLRAGQQVNTTNIGFIHDTYNTLTDTTAQSLLGRVCGYNKEKDEVNCYVDIKAAKKMLLWINYNYDKGFIPVKSKNILNGNSCNSLNWKLHSPLYISLLDEYKDMFLTFKNNYGNRYPYKNKLISAILNSIDSVEDEYLYNKVYKIISQYSFGRFGGLMVLSNNNALRSFNENWTALYKSYINKSPVRGFEVDSDQLQTSNKFYYIFCNLNIFSNTFGGCLIVYKKWLDNEAVLYKPDIKLNIKSRFTLMTAGGGDLIAATGGI